MERIGKEDSLWRNPPFAAEAVLFYLLFRLADYEDALRLTDRESFVLVQTSPDRSAWVWTAETISKAQLTCARDAMKAHDIHEITAKPEVVGHLLPRHRLHEAVIANHCLALKAPAQVPGEPSRMEAKDQPRVAEMLAGFTNHVERVETRAEDHLEAAGQLVGSDAFCLWRAADRQPVAMARHAHATTAMAPSTAYIPRRSTGAMATRARRWYRCAGKS